MIESVAGGDDEEVADVAVIVAQRRNDLSGNKVNDEATTNR